MTGHEIGGTLQQELVRTAEMLVNLSEDQGIYFAIALLVDSSYDHARMSKLLPVLQTTRNAVNKDRRKVIE